MMSFYMFVPPLQNFKSFVPENSLVGSKKRNRYASIQQSIMLFLKEFIDCWDGVFPYNSTTRLSHVIVKT